MQNGQGSKKRQTAWAGILFILALLFCFVFFLKKPMMGTKGDNKVISVQGFYLNTSVTITAYDSKDEALLKEALLLCDHYENIFSRTREESELYKLNHRTLPMEDGWYLISEDLARLIEKGLFYSEMSDGAFDLTVEPITSLWDFTAKEPVVPDAQQIAHAVAEVDYQKVELQGNRIRFADERMGIELGAIAKGYIADQIKAFLMEHEVKSAIIDLGGNILCVGERPDKEAFRVGIQKPFAKRSETVAAVKIKDRSVVSSGIYERCFEKDGVLYHHILNPKTGYPYENELISVTILSEQSVDGDALSTTCFALGLDKGMELIEALPDVDAVFVTEDGKLHYSKNFEEMYDLIAI